MAASPAVPNAAPPVAEEVVFTRVLDAPRELVFEAWVSRTALARWWGPKGFSVSSCDVDPRAGGVYRIVMRGPDGTEYPMDGVFREFVRPERLVFSSVVGHGGKVDVLTVVTFAEERGRTRLTVRQTVPSDPAMARGQRRGWNESLDRLAAELVREDAVAARVFDAPPGAPEFVQRRMLDAPRAAVFAAWTELDRLKEWWGPKGFTWLSGSLDARPGSLFHYGLKGPDGKTMWGRFVYHDVDPPRRLVFVVSFSDETGGIARAPFGTDWPLEVLNVLTLEEKSGRTMLTLRGWPIRATEAENKAFAAARTSMEHGFTGTFDQLAAYLATVGRGGVS